MSMSTGPIAPLKLSEIPSEAWTLRRVIFLGVALTLTLFGGMLLVDVYLLDGLSPVEAALIPLFIMLFSQIAIGFTLAFIGFFQLIFGGDNIQIMRTLPRDARDAPPLAGTAIVLPVFNEDIGRVLRAVENMYRRVQETGEGRHFDFFILSDSNQPDAWIREEAAWVDLCKRLNAFGKIFYRKRRVPLNQKSGNIADFCRRWGKRYRYMIVMDADSVMTARCMVRLVQAMELNHQVGLIQTIPNMVLGDTLFRRLFQFVARICGPLFTAGSNFWHLGGGNFWGHNAIVRLAPFIEHCGLPDLPETERSKRHILSHDTVEAALMRRAGYQVWIALEEEGSYEEGPPNLTDMLKRDRRWCQGNLQHFWFLFAKRLDFSNRLHIYQGLMSYLTAPLWFLFLLLSAMDATTKYRYHALTALQGNSFSGTPYTAVELLLVMTLALLFVPKILGFLLSIPHAERFGGVARMGLSLVLETAISVVLAPILMLFHTRFVLLTLLGLKVAWTTQNRDGTAGLAWSDCWKTYWWVTVTGIITGLISWHFLPSFFWWFLPIFGSWVLSIPFAWWTSRPGPGLLARKLGLFLIPEEVTLPPELQGLESEEPLPEFWPPRDRASAAGLVQALLNPYVNAIHISLLRQKVGPKPGEGDRDIEELRTKLLEKGPSALTREQQMKLLWSADSLIWLHQKLWSTSSQHLPDYWKRVFAELSGKA